MKGVEVARAAVCRAVSQYNEKLSWKRSGVTKVLAFRCACCPKKDQFGFCVSG